MHNNNIINTQYPLLESSYRSRARLSHSLSASVNAFLEIIKFKITVLVSLTTGLGYILASSRIDFSILYSIAGIFLLACSASALNHYQERNTDRLMKRTLARPIPSGRIKPASVLVISIAVFVAGLLILLLKTNIMTSAIGLLTFLWYNGVYTPLKKKTAWAIIPGSLVGALPPMAGWAAAGGYIFDPKILIIALYFFIWQIPHFWLLLMLYGEDYKAGGFPTLQSIFSQEQLKRVTFMWLVATVILALLVPLFGIINHTLTELLLIAVSVWMLMNAFRFLVSETERKLVVNSFLRINFFTLLFITLLSLDKLISLI